MAHQVIEEERKADILQQIQKEIEEETREKPEQKEVFRRYQPKMTAIMKGLDDNELEKARAKADEWTNQAPDAAVQAKTAKKKGEKMIKHFAKEMFTQAGMRLFVLGSWKDEQGSLLTSGQVHAFIRFNFNEQLGKGSSFMECKDWQVILPAWEDFIGDMFPHLICVTSTKIRIKTRMACCSEALARVPNHTSLPILPDIDGFSLNTKKGVIWSFLTIHYRMCCGKLKVPVPWSDIMKGQSRFISSTYLPDGTQIMEPSKMHRDEAISLLECWLDRQDNQVSPTFQFKAWIDDKGKMHPPAHADQKVTGPRLHCHCPGHPKGRPRSIKRAYISSTDEESSDADAELSDQVGRQSESDDQPPPMSLVKSIRVEPATILPQTDLAHKDRPIVDLATEGSEDEDCGSSATNTGYHFPGVHHAGQHAHGFGPHSTCRGLEHIQASPAAKVRAPNKTRATRDASLSVKARSPRKTGATADASLVVQDRLPKKTRATQSAAYPLSDAPAKRTRSKVDDLLGARPWQKPKRYADYV
ncbi:uncharacterized protein EDB91DRAFT_1086744 [Suillus paluster]|uniref:uncharacterized protein n=1 Tax=Suillus paluster TaxID=48578 RepID=UPI001B885ED6|nr:uncharacterized protein EDB91DRAFT_1086744 [Suillus paluster]KAG1726510.1 hypothetical protein EDB91DRAFT_1086744 [Suillus paluster]